jgi:murein DD-endopeptidase MepM/ murein hydrolase activator NlpD
MPRLSLLAALPEPHLWLERPIGDDGTNYIEATYRYGTTQNGSLQPHHGVEFYNPVGTPILAAADGIVVFAGPDIARVPLSPEPNFYGNVVVVELAQSLDDQPIFNLYGHMSAISVKPGQTVQAGDALGQVGGTGVARGGSHLHFEVRVGYDDYESTRNPELWLKPFKKWGVLAGRVVDKNGTLIPQVSISIRSESIEGDQPLSRFFTTYASETVNPDPAYGENFVIGDLPPGIYTVSVGTTKTYKQTIEVKADVVTWVEFRDVNRPPTWTPTPTGTRYTSTPTASTVAATPTGTATPKP